MDDRPSPQGEDRIPLTGRLANRGPRKGPLLFLSGASKAPVLFGQHRSESFLIYRRGRPVARLAPAEAATGRAIKDLLRRRAPDDRWAVELAELRAGLVSEESPWRD